MSATTTTATDVDNSLRQQLPLHLRHLSLPAQVVRDLIRMQQEQQRMEQAHRQVTVSDRELLDIVRRQWKPSWSLLNYFTVDVPPRQPFTPELTHYPTRSKYYETFVCTWTFVFSILLIFSLEYLLRNGRLREFVRNGRRATALQFLILVVPFQVAVLDFPFKRYVPFVLTFNAACLLCYIACLLLSRRQHQSPGRQGIIGARSVEFSGVSTMIDMTKQSSASSGDSATRGRPPAFNDVLSIYRSIVYISTAVCIFARDQPCWNNDFSKTYSFGTGLMDVGIGCFIVCIGSLGPTAVRRLDSVNRRQTLRKAAVQAVILTGCGLVKTASAVVVRIVRTSSLPAAAGAASAARFDDAWREYGVHWNAFYSLAVARLLGAGLELLALPPRVPPLAAAALLAVGHEAALAGGLAEWVLAPGKTEPYNRDSLVGQNREGLASVPGLLTLYFAGLQLGRWARHWAEVDATRWGRLAVCGKFAALMTASMAWRPLAVQHWSAAVLPESRRLMNPSYCAWVVAFSCFCLVCSCAALEAKRHLLLRTMVSPAADSSGSGAGTGAVEGTVRLMPLHLQQIDSAGLLYFIVSNLLTGIFNFAISLVVANREKTDGPACFFIILSYTVAAFCCTRAAESRLNFRLLQDRLMRTSCCCSA